MAKLSWFSKKGRPSKKEDDFIKKIQSELKLGNLKRPELNKYVKDNGVPNNLDDLESMYTLITGEDTRHEQSIEEKQTSIDEPIDSVDEDINSDINEGSNVGGDSTDVNSEEPYSSVEGDEFPEPEYESGNGEGVNLSSEDAMHFDPLDKAVIERSYTSGDYVGTDDTIGIDSDETESFTETEYTETEEIASDVELNEDIPTSTDGFIMAEDVVEDDIPEPEWANTTFEEEIEETESEEDLEEEKEPLGGDNLQDLSPTQKRKSAEKTADTLIMMYCKFVPLPFIKFSKFSDKKVTKMVLEGVIDLKMQLEGSVNIEQYIKSHNEQVEEVFIVSDETKEEIREPLIEVLLEQELALTPTQRLMIAIGGNVLTMLFASIQLSRSSSVALETFAKFQKDRQPQQRHKANRSDFTDVSSSVNYSATNSNSDKDMVEDLMSKMNENESDVIDPNHDPSVTIEEVDVEDVN